MDDDPDDDLNDYNDYVVEDAEVGGDDDVESGPDDGRIALAGPGSDYDPESEPESEPAEADEQTAILVEEMFDGSLADQPAAAADAAVKILPRSEYYGSDFISAIEMAAVLSARAEAIGKTGLVFTPDHLQHAEAPEERALEELLAGYCPLVIWRERSHGGPDYVVEEWPVRELLVPPKLGY